MRASLCTKQTVDEASPCIVFAVRHAHRYGEAEMAERWSFEVWNEPGAAPNGDWWGTPAEYLQLYSHAARAIKKVSPQLRVGGPAGCFGSWGNGKAGCLETFIDFCRNNASVRRPPAAVSQFTSAAEEASVCAAASPNFRFCRGRREAL